MSSLNHLFVNEFKSIIFLNNRDGSFSVKDLPLITQSSVIRDIQTLDYNSDNNLDLLLLGNMSSVSPYFGSFDSNYGILLEGNGTGGFNYVDQLESGLKIRGDVVKILTLDENRTNFIIAKNSEKLSFISLSN